MSGNEHYTLVKRWRVGEVIHPTTRTHIGLYLHSESGKFYARIPEVNDGFLVQHETKSGLEALVLKEAQRLLGLNWRKVIRVQLIEPMDMRQFGLHGWNSEMRRWNPEDPTTAGTTIQMRFNRFEVATDPSGRMVERDWEDEYPVGHPMHRDRRVNGRSEIPLVFGNSVELEYTEETWVALQAFQRRIVEMNHQLRTLITQPDLVLLLEKARFAILESKNERLALHGKASDPGVDGKDS